MTNNSKQITYMLSILSFLMTGLVFYACSGDSDRSQHNDNMMPIIIGGGKEAAVGGATRAGERNLEEILGGLGLDKNFRVWCYKTMGIENNVYTEPQTVMDRFIVQWTQNTAGSTVSNTADWEYVGIQNSYLGEGSLGVQDIKYWDMNATSYRFFGFAPCNRLDAGASANYTYPADHGDGYRWFDITFPADATRPENAPYISNLWFSNNSADGKHKYRDCVTMEFMKPVCKVRIKLLKMDGTPITNPEADGFTELEFKPDGGALIVQAGNLKVSYAITGPTTVANYTPSVTIEGSPTGTVCFNSKKTGYDNYIYVLPHVEQGTYQLVAQIGSKQKIATVPANYMSWQPNMEYTYTFKMTDNEFQFIDVVQVAVTEWRTQTKEHEIYNW